MGKKKKPPGKDRVALVLAIVLVSFQVIETLLEIANKLIDLLTR